MRARRKSRLLRHLGAWALVLAIVTALPYAAGARTDREIEQAIQQLLVERHPNDTAEWWKKLGPQAPRVIISMYERSDDIYHRTRLIGALGHYPADARAVEYLRGQAEVTSDEVIREKAIRALGISQGVKELDTVSKYLSHEDPQTRLAAAETIRGMSDPLADARLEEYLKSERAQFVVQRVRRERRQASTPLVPVSTSEDRLNPEFAGNWKGVLVHPAGAEGMATRRVALSLRLDGQALAGELLLPGSGTGASETRVPLKEVSGARSVMAARLPPASLSPGLVSKSELVLNGELREQAGHLVLEVSIPSHAATILLRKVR